ncbi:MAG: hypothetical protein WDN66_01585 [Candidatus Saccharibacteria bacterium]
MVDPQEQLPNLTDEQQRLVAVSYLQSLANAETSLLPNDVFLAVGKLVVLNTVEVAFVKPSNTDERDAQVLLTQRSNSDPLWANQWHIPGSIVRAKDPVKHEHDYDAAVSRIFKEVGGGIQVVRDPFEYDVVRRKGQRSSETTVRLMAESAGEPVNGAFFNAEAVLNKPPEGGLLESHAEAIEKLAKKYHDLKSN